MTNKELIKFLRDNKDNPAFGGSDFDSRESWNTFARKYSDLGFTENPGPFVMTWRDYFEYFTHVSSKTILRPVGATLSALIIIFGSWVATVNASFGSIPGDLLYPVKLVSERMQITLAATDEQKARLHTEFAGRRLREVMEIASAPEVGNEVRMQAAVEGFKQEVASANVAVESMAANSSQNADSVAIMVDQQVESYMTTLATAQEGSVANPVQEESLADAQTTVTKTDASITETLVTSHEENQVESTGTYLQTSFQKDLKNIDVEKFSLEGRIARIESLITLGNLPNADVIQYQANIKIIQSELKGFETNLSEARNLFAAGGWRRVLEIVTDLKTKLSVADEMVAAMEIQISTTGSLGE